MQPRLHHQHYGGNVRLTASGRPKALSAQIALPRETNSTLRRVQPRQSHEAKAKTPLCANSVVDSVSLPLPAPSAKVFSREARTKALSAKDLSREVKNEAPLSAKIVSLKGGALYSKAKLAFKDRGKTAASPCEATLLEKAILASPIPKKKALKAKLKVSQPKRANIQFP